MKKKTLTIILIIVAVLIVVAVCISLKSCSSSEQNGDGTKVSQDEAGTDETDNEMVNEDVADWGEATEGIVDEDTVKPNASGSSTTSHESDIDNKKQSDNTSEDGAEKNNTGDLTPKTYTITYDVNNENATIETTTQKVTYGEAFTLVIPKLKDGDDYRFVKWVITGTSNEFKSGIYSIKGDVSLTAMWEDNYSKNY